MDRPLYDRLCDAVGKCEEVERAFTAANKLCDEVWRALPKAAEDFADADPVALDIFAQRQFLARLKAFLTGQIAREEYDPQQEKPTSPYAKDLLSSGKPFIRSHDRPLHDAWTEGFKTDDERQDEEAERRADEEQGR